MKIAIATDKGAVSEHFGHCEGFTIYEVENNKVVSTDFKPNPGHVPGYLPNFLNDQGVKVIIAGGMGGGAIEIFNEKAIETVTGISGKTDETIAKYLAGELASSGSVCHAHQHADSCGEHQSKD